MKWRLRALKFATISGTVKGCFVYFANTILEGIVCKHRNYPYLMANGETGWVKVRNPNYSQIIGRDELFDRREADEVPDWDGCVEACIAIQESTVNS